MSSEPIALTSSPPTRGPAARAALRGGLLLLIMGLAGFALYRPGLDIPYFADDFEFVMDPAVPSWQYLVRRNPFNGFARPLQAVYLAWVQARWGFDTVPVHVAQLSLHVLLAWGIGLFMLRRGFSAAQALAGSGFMLLAQANAHPVLNNDTLSQVMGTLAGYLGVWLLYLTVAGPPGPGPPRPRHRSGRYVSSIACIGVAMLSKETSVCFLLMLPVVLWIAARESHRKLSARGLILPLLPFVAAAVAYLAYRSALGLTGPAGGEGRYGFHVGRNVLVNLAEFAAGLLVPFSSVDVYTAVQERDRLYLLVCAWATLALLVMVAMGLHRDGRRRLWLLMAGGCAVAMFPVVLLNRVGEGYLYNVSPPLSVLIGGGLGWFCSAPRRSVRMAGVLAIGALLMSHSLAVRGKIVMMQGNGHRAELLLPELRAFVEDAGKGARVELVEPAPDIVNYSVFRMSGFGVVAAGCPRLPSLWGRPDVKMEVLRPGEPLPPQHPNVVLLRLVDGHIGRLPVGAGFETPSRRTGG